jgi:hypothetical protein
MQKMERAAGHVVSRFLVFYVRKYNGYRRCRAEWMDLSMKFREGAAGRVERSIGDEKAGRRASGIHTVIRS